MSMKLAEKTWPMIQDYLKANQSILIPVGSTEQHGPTGIIGTDFLTSERIAEQVANTCNVLLAPTLPFGMAAHHMAFPGTMSLTPSTYVQVIVELIESLTIHGFNKLYFINGHGGNIAPITTAFCESKLTSEKHNTFLINWWHLQEVTDYESKVFGDSNGFHATCGEISVTQYINSQAFLEIPNQKLLPTSKKKSWPLSPQEFKTTFPDGRMESLPQLATPAHGEKIFKAAIESISKMVRENNG